MRTGELSREEGGMLAANLVCYFVKVDVSTNVDSRGTGWKIVPLQHCGLTASHSQESFLRRHGFFLFWVLENNLFKIAM